MFPYSNDVLFYICEYENLWCFLFYRENVTLLQGALTYFTEKEVTVPNIMFLYFNDVLFYICEYENLWCFLFYKENVTLLQGALK